MNETTPVFNWQNALSATWNEIASQVVSFIPHLLMAFLLLLVGWLVATILGAVARRSVILLSQLLQRMPATEAWVPKGTVKTDHARILGRVVFWTVMLFFITASTNALGWQMFSGWMSSLIANLPNVITGVLIIFAGYLLANVVQVAAYTAATSASMSHPAIPARIARLVTFFTAVVIGIEQAGINVGFLTTLLIVILTVILAGGALAFGIGARALVANIIGIQQLRKHARIGDRIGINGYEGVLIEITQTCLILDTSKGRVLIPAQLFNEQVSELHETNGHAVTQVQKTGGSDEPNR